MKRAAAWARALDRSRVLHICIAVLLVAGAAGVLTYREVTETTRTSAGKPGSSAGSTTTAPGKRGGSRGKGSGKGKGGTATSQPPTASGTPSTLAPLAGSTVALLPPFPRTLLFSYVAGPDATPDKLPAAQYKDPRIAGISWKFRWSTLEPSPGTFDFTLVDQALAATQAAGKAAMIRVIAGVNSPSWVYDAGAQSIAFTASDLGNASYVTGPEMMPLPWDPVYLDQWTRFVTELGRRYDHNPTIFSIQMSGGGRIGEMALPQSAPWTDKGFTNDKLIGAYDRIISTYMSAFPNTPTNLDIDEPLGPNSNVMHPVVDMILSRYPGRIFLQQNGLKSTYANGMNDFRTTLRAANSITRVGYQMGGRTKTGDGSGQGASNLSASLRVAKDDGSRYVEVYSNDIADASNGSALAVVAT